MNCSPWWSAESRTLLNWGRGYVTTTLYECALNCAVLSPVSETQRLADMQSAGIVPTVGIQPTPNALTPDAPPHPSVRLAMTRLAPDDTP